jgi:hypothetical protein
LDRWHAKWLDPQEERSRNNGGLAGVIHWLSEPNRDNDQQSFVVDFGSSPVEAFDELLTALAKIDVQKVTVASFGHR